MAEVDRKKRYQIVAAILDHHGRLRGIVESMHESVGNVVSLRFANSNLVDASRGPAQLTFCYQCHCAVDLGATAAALRSGHWARIGTCAHCGTTITRILKAS